jgi:predicted HAD superfamily phosphohydrolase YqeG
MVTDMSALWASFIFGNSFYISALRAFVMFDNRLNDISALRALVMCGDQLSTDISALWAFNCLVILIRDVSNHDILYC